MNYSINFTKFSSVFAVPSLSEQTLCTASASALKILLFLMQNQSQPIDPRYLSDRLLLPYEEVLSALAFWNREGLLTEGGSSAAVPEPVAVAAAPTAQPVQVVSRQEQAAHVSMGLKAQQKTMRIDEIDRLSQEDSSIRQLLDAVQLQMGKNLTRSEMETVASFYTYAGLPPECILLATAHCCAQNRANMRAVAKLITDMMSDGIYTYEQAEQYLTRRQEQDNAQGQVRLAFGIHDRALTRQECKYIDTWFLEYHFDIAMVKLAYERAINQIGKLSFPYINKILASWHDKGIQTTQEAVAERQPSKQDKTENSSIDFDQIQQFITYGEVKS